MDDVSISSDNNATAEERGAGQGVGDAPQAFDMDASRSQSSDLQAYLFGKECSSEVERTKKKEKGREMQGGHACDAAASRCPILVSPQIMWLFIPSMSSRDALALVVCARMPSLERMILDTHDD